MAEKQVFISVSGPHESPVVRHNETIDRGNEMKNFRL